MAKKVKELFDLEINEVSAVDKPAIGEEIYVIKSMTNKNKGATVAKPVKKGLVWKEGVQKNASENNTHCVFCGITKEDESESMGMGLIKGVCFACACEHDSLGVFDACVDGTFDAEKFAADHTDMTLKLTLEKAGDEDESEGEEPPKEPKEGEETPPKEEGKEGETPPAEKTAKTGEENEGEAGSELDNTELSKRVITLEKNIGEVSTMLEQSLALHDLAAGAMNEIVMLTFGSLDMLMSMVESEEMSEEGKSLFAEINDSIKSVREDVTKAGAKISASRMSVLREISEKLAQLISSVMGEEKTESKTKALDEVQKSLVEIKEELKKEISDSNDSLKEDVETKLKGLSDKLEDIEQSGGASLSLGEDDEEESETPEETEKSIFSNVVGLSDITKNIERKRRNFDK